mmetsp:Transcript_20519/g.60706  ORF Transcript_20519/g.60706 Transcript_20519/m.60706 type:complete len:418 (-) Transcript_20519:1917-3170(-)
MLRLDIGHGCAALRRCLRRGGGGLEQLRRGRCELGDGVAEFARGGCVRLQLPLVLVVVDDHHDLREEHRERQEAHLHRLPLCVHVRLDGEEGRRPPRLVAGAHVKRGEYDEQREHVDVHAAPLGQRVAGLEHGAPPARLERARRRVEEEEREAELGVGPHARGHEDGDRVVPLPVGPELGAVAGDGEELVEGELWHRVARKGEGHEQARPRLGAAPSEQRHRRRHGHRQSKGRGAGQVAREGDAERVARLAALAAGPLPLEQRGDERGDAERDADAGEDQVGRLPSADLRALRGRGRRRVLARAVKVERGGGLDGSRTARRGGGGEAGRLLRLDRATPARGARGVRARQSVQHLLVGDPREDGGEGAECGERRVAADGRGGGGPFGLELDAEEVGVKAARLAHQRQPGDRDGGAWRE